MRQRAPPPPTGCVPLLFCCHLLRRPLLSVHVLPVRDLHVSSGRVGVSGASGEFAGLPARLRTLLLLNLAPRPSGHGCSPTPTARAPFAAAAVAAPHHALSASVPPPQPVAMQLPVPGAEGVCGHDCGRRVLPLPLLLRLP